MLYPPELRAHRLKLRTYGAFANGSIIARQPSNGTNRKTAAHYGTVMSQSAAQTKKPRPLIRANGATQREGTAL